jgi:hypothetical protein
VSDKTTLTLTHDEVKVVAAALRSYVSNTVAISRDDPPQSAMLRELLVHQRELAGGILAVIQPLVTVT